jgi:hypothetical protein
MDDDFSAGEPPQYSVELLTGGKTGHMVYVNVFRSYF